MHGAEAGLLKQTHQIRFGAFLKGKDCGGLEAQVVLEILGDFADETPEGTLADQELGAPLEAPNLTKSDGSRSVHEREKTYWSMLMR
jgi:hypothetical protein